ncbi:FdtA/QdtA family cupin domain-containing protein [Hymenobacter koreensis]|uniref:FdtA/QdtA family cupin domain-containing protein n=2 Tax=Hymenobacter koreensis TaxID=1084523 RepID=A0ABP8IU39_9BACT
MCVPHLIEFSKVGALSLGYLTVAQNSQLPFTIERVYWTYFTPDEVLRGHHAHHDLEQIIFAVSGRIVFTLEDVEGHQQTFELSRPNIGLYVPRMFWRTIRFSHNAVLLCLASKEYDEQDYIRDYNSFKTLK